MLKVKTFPVISRPFADIIRSRCPDTHYDHTHCVTCQTIEDRLMRLTQHNSTMQTLLDDPTYLDRSITYLIEELGWWAHEKKRRLLGYRSRKR